MAEQTEAQKKAAEAKAAYEAKKKLLPDYKIAVNFGILWLEKDQSDKKKYNNQDALDEAEKAAKALIGLKAKKSQTLTNRGTRLTLVKGYPVSEYFASLFSDAQKEQYFKK